MMRHRHALMAIVAVGLLGATVACSSSSSPGSAAGTASANGKTITNVVFGYSNANIFNWATTTMAYDPGYCAPYGVRVSPVVLNTTAYTAAIDSDQVNFVFPAGNVLLAMTKGVVHNEKVIAYQGLNAPTEVYGLWGGPQITSPSQLVGKTLGATSATSPSHIGAVALLEHAGISESQVHFTYLPSNAALQAALAHGTIAAAWNNGPMDPANVAAGDHIVISLSTDPALRPINGVFTVGNEAFMTAHPAAVKGVLECLAAATKAGRSTDPAVVGQMQANLAKQMGAASSVAAKAWPEYPISAGVLPMTAANVALLQQSMSLQMQKAVPLATIQGIVDAKWMQGVTPVPVVDYTGASQFPAYSGK
jgi:ABC-type nitrate/sulfonate/bicarbonate transport system substrate-binding protein